MADMTATTMATYLPEQWSELVSVTYRSNVVLPGLMDRRWEPEIGVGEGDTVNVPTFTQNTSASKRSTFGTGASLTFDAVQETQTQILIDQMAYKAFRMPVEMSLQKMKVYLPLLVSGVSEAIALKVDSELAGDDSNGLDALTSIGVDNEDITEDVLFTGEINLDDNSAPMTDRFLVVSPASRASLMKIEAFRNSLYGGAVGNLDGDKGPGYLGHTYTYDVITSNNLESGTRGKKNAMFQRECIAYCEQQSVRMAKGLNIADGLFDEVAGWMVYGHKLVKDTFGREIAGK